MVTAASPQIPPPLLEQLKIGGKLVSPVGDGLSQNMVRIVKTKIGFEEDTYPGFRFVPLVGSHGFPSPGG
jgi:protein-L-isoaspartate(D-aspartate) O-methyltransferase